MSLAQTDLADPAASPTNRYRFWFTHVVACVAWTSFGIALTLLTVVLPRKAELSHRPDPTPFLRHLKMKDLIQESGINVNWSHTSETPVNALGLGRINGGRVSEFHAIARVKPSEQQALFRTISAALTANASKQLGGQVWPTNSPGTYAGPDSLFLSDRHSYMSDGLAGTIEMWGVGHGDQLAIIVSIHEQ